MSGRLEEIKNRRKNYRPDVLPIWFEDMDWLIEQVEAYKKDSLDLQEINEQNFKRIEELEREIKGLEQAYDEVDDKNLGLEEQNERYREALENALDEGSLSESATQVILKALY